MATTRNKSSKSKPSSRKRANGNRMTAAIIPNRGRLQARYDAAVTNADNRRHWANADSLNADGACSPEVRRTLRERGRYEQFNNPMMQGIISTHSGDMIGPVPRLQMTTGHDATDQLIEREFNQWARKIKLGKKLRIITKTVDGAGEAFVIMGYNPALNTPVKLDLRVYEGDQVHTPDLWGYPPDLNRTDGIEYDRFGNPTFYHFLRRHPGDTRGIGISPMEYDRVPADSVLHFFMEERPGQLRGIPRITASLPLTADRRRMRLATVAAAEVAAELGAITLESSMNPEDATEELAPMETVEIERGMMTTLPNGYKANQMRPEQPGTTHGDFNDSLNAESARPLNMPANIARCDSSGYNFASGRLDHQTYDLANGVDRYDIEVDHLDRVVDRWMAEAVLIPGYLPYRARVLWERGSLTHNWLWRGRKHVDRTKEANADKTELQTGSGTLTDILGERGIDIEDHVAKKQREQKLLAAAGLAQRETMAGQQADAALVVIDRVRSKSIVPAAAIQFLIALGVPSEQARIAVEETDKAAGTLQPPPEQQATQDEPAPMNGSGRNGTGLNGTHKPGGRLAEVLP